MYGGRLLVEAANSESESEGGHVCIGSHEGEARRRTKRLSMASSWVACDIILSSLLAIQSSSASAGSAAAPPIGPL
jgi:hypothetical protein